MWKWVTSSLSVSEVEFPWHKSQGRIADPVPDLIQRRGPRTFQGGMGTRARDPLWPGLRKHDWSFGEVREERWTIWSQPFGHPDGKAFAPGLHPYILDFALCLFCAFTQCMCFALGSCWNLITALELRPPATGKEGEWVGGATAQKLWTGRCWKEGCGASGQRCFMVALWGRGRLSGPEWRVFQKTGQTERGRGYQRQATKWRVCAKAAGSMAVARLCGELPRKTCRRAPALGLPQRRCGRICNAGFPELLVDAFSAEAKCLWEDVSRIWFVYHISFCNTW